MKALDISSRIQYLLHINDEQYHNMVFEAAYAWIRREIVNDEWGEKIITQGAHFWRWWTRLWDIRNRNFYNEHLANCEELLARERARLLDLYRQCHTPDGIIAFPGRKVVDETYAICMQHMIDNALKAEEVRQ